MPEFRPRKATYIKERNGQFFYRRAIPMASRAQFGGLTEWNIRLEGRTHSERVSEAHAHAHRHNQDIAVGIGGRIVSRVEESQTLDGPDLSIRLDATQIPLPPGMALQPFRAHRDGTVVETFKIALSRDPDFLREAEKDGFFPMHYEEGAAQLELNQLLQQASLAENDDRKEIAELKAEKMRSVIDSLGDKRGETILSALPKWEKRDRPRLT